MLVWRFGRVVTSLMNLFDGMDGSMDLVLA
jgi:hypothetical protein